ncbi:hypothetical protein OG535_06725 [Kitasatospora sp. NBC_00085]|uniref:hypothetical protein n=1 Tax=unclassified Kitasatospora TaxID=2633591 RepID=UPI0032521E55
MDDLMHKLVSGALSGGLIALVGGLSVLVRRRRVARAEAAAPAPVEDLSQTLLRQAQEADRSREALAAQAGPAAALDPARTAADLWRRLTEMRQGRFQAERQSALTRLGELLAAAGRPDEAARVRQEIVGLG